MTPPTTDIEFLHTMVEQGVQEEGPSTVTDAVHGKRIMPAGTPLPGIVDIYRTPYLIEPMENMSPSSPVRRTTIMKSVQSAVTWFAENVIAAWSRWWPTKLLYLTATDKALQKWTKRVEPLITSMGLRERIVASNTDRKTRTTGDKTLSKTFKGGGALEMGSLQSPSDLASDSVQVAIADEIDRAPEKLKSGEGNFLRVLAGRLEAFLWKAKLLAFSTPTTWEASLVYKEFKQGDQREYFVPCKHCGHMFFMEFKHLQPEYDERGLLSHAWLKCPKCNGKHINGDKTWMLAPENGAHWRPMAVPQMEGHRSYHISKMMVPVGLATWTNIYQEYINAKAADDMAPFYNLQLGLPYKESGSKPKIIVEDMKGGYSERDIPDGVLFLTVGMDVQQGSRTNLAKPPRLEMEVIGHGKNFRTWGIEYKVFTDPEWPDGPGIKDPSSGAWQAFIQWGILDGRLQYKRADGCIFTPAMMFIDSGDGVTMDTVYQFTERPDIIPGWIFPSKGVGFFKKNKDIEGDTASQQNMMKYKPSKNVRSGDVIFYDVATNHYKKMIYRNLKLKREADPGKEQRMGFCDFPQGAGYDAHYFKMLTSEVMWADGSFHKESYSNEALDCRVYGLCAGDVWLDIQVARERERIRQACMKQGVKVDPLQLQTINRLWILDRLEAALSRQ
ncbi:MAG: terminase gpA endonuclease subunit [Planctomycetota bacterium]|jgi:phage terminase large subunit GpA-like protein